MIRILLSAIIVFLAWSQLSIIPLFDQLTISGFNAPEILKNTLRAGIYGIVVFALLSTRPVRKTTNELSFMLCVFILVSLVPSMPIIMSINELADQEFTHRLRAEKSQGPSLFDRAKDLLSGPGAVDPFKPGGHKYEALLKETRKKAWRPVFKSPWKYFGQIWKYTLPLSLLVYMACIPIRTWLTRRFGFFNPQHWAF